MRARPNGVSTGWDKNYFLEFAPNVKKLVAADSMRGGGGPMTKEKMIRGFWKDLGIDGEEDGAMNHKCMKDVAPEPWEVRARLREMIQKNEDKKEVELLKSLEHPLLVRGEIDQKLKTKAERGKVYKKRKIDKEKEYLDAANETLNKNYNNNKTGTKSKEINAASRAMFKKTNDSYHKRAAPGRFFGGAKAR